MDTYKLRKGESLSEGYYVEAGSDRDHENLLVEVHAPDGLIATLSREEGDRDVVVHWPGESGWERAQTGSFTDIMRALEFGKEHLLSYQRSSADS